MNRLPQSRTESIIVQDLDKEILIYDLNTNKAFCLNETSTIVYQNCDGRTSFDELKAGYPNLTDELIILAIEGLQKENLLQDKFESGVSRRSLLSKAAFAALALPLITSLVAPVAVQAASCVAKGSACTDSAQCCPQYCQFGSNANIIGCIGGACTQIITCPV